MFGACWMGEVSGKGDEVWLVKTRGGVRKGGRRDHRLVGLVTARVAFRGRSWARAAVPAGATSTPVAAYTIHGRQVARFLYSYLTVSGRRGDGRWRLNSHGRGGRSG